jgi:hypothetical protein
LVQNTKYRLEPQRAGSKAPHAIMSYHSSFLAKLNDPSYISEVEQGLANFWNADLVIVPVHLGKEGRTNSKNTLVSIRPAA